MTCYETLRAPAPAADVPMAHHFVKWWRNKFRNGYKKFSIGDGERTDTEELVGRASQCSAPPDLLPSEARALLQPSPPSPPSPPLLDTHDHHKPRLRFEELTCDVELKHAEPSTQPLQFSFTLYDLDGHGRMTKDDIAGIVSTIYESIGKSVTVPHYGSKTIQVRLTVSPEGARGGGRGGGATRARRARRPPTQQTDLPEEPSEDERADRLSDDDSSKSSSSAERPPRPAPRPPRTRRDHRDRKHTKKRSGSLQRRELLEIIQANMEKNHMNFQTTRKSADSAAKDKDEEIIKRHKHRTRSHTVHEKPAHAFQKESSRNGYLDLATGGGDSHLCRYDRYLHAVICSSARHAHTGFHHKQPPRARAPAARAREPPRPPAHPPRVLQIIFL